MSKVVGEELVLSIKATGGVAPLAYTWNKGGVVIQGANADTVNLKPLTVEMSGVYSCIVTDKNGATLESAKCSVTVTEAK